MVAGAAAAVATPRSLHAQQPAVEMPTVEVIGASPLIGSGIDRNSVPAATHVLDYRDIERRGVPDLLWSLNPQIPEEIRRLIREMSLANRLWGAPRIHGELLKLGIEVAQSTVAKYMAKSGRGRSQTWKTFLHNHTAGVAAMDFLIVPTVGFRLLFVLAILRHKRRRLISLRVTTNPMAEWIARQITDAFSWNEAPDYLIRDRDASYGHAVTKRLAAMGIRDYPIAPRSPWQNGHAERLIAPDTCGLCELLQRVPNSSLLGQGFASPSADPTAR
jgi:transposase InsO family protein